MISKTGKATSFPLRLPVTMRQELNALAKREGISINQLISLAVAEKIVRCQGQAGPGYADPKLPARHEFDPYRQLDTNPLVLGTSLKMESAQHFEKLISAPAYSNAGEAAAICGGAPTNGSANEQNLNSPESQVGKSRGTGFVF